MLTYVVGVSCVFKTYHSAADVPKKVEKTSHDIAVFIHTLAKWVKLGQDGVQHVSPEVFAWSFVACDGASRAQSEASGLKVSLQG